MPLPHSHRARRLRPFVLTLLPGLLVQAACGGGTTDTVAAAGTGGTTTPPGAPTLVAVTAGDRSAVVSFTAPTSAGSAAISSYGVTCVAGALSGSATGAASPLSITGLTNGSSYTCSVTATSAAGTSGASAGIAVTPIAASAGSAVDPTRLPLGDRRFTRTAPAVGMVYACYTAVGSGGARVQGPWFNADGTTWDSLAKISVRGVVNWTSNFMVSMGSTLNITGNGLPSTPTGTFPIASTDPAYAYDRNPNSIAMSTLAWGLPANPVVATSPICTGLGAIGVLLDGARLFNADDGANRDAVAWEVQDACQGHPQASGQYHHHSISTCLTQRDVAGQHSPLVGYIADGFGIYGNLGENGAPLTNADLDECHGHTHAITVNGASLVQYHYHQTKEFPYTIGCFKGRPATLN